MIKRYNEFNSLKESRSITTDDLQASKYTLDDPYGTTCGHTNTKNNSLTNSLVMEFIDIFFGGELDNIEVYKEDGCNLVEGGEPTLFKLEITNKEFEYFSSKLSLDRDMVIRDLCERFDFKKKQFADIEKNIPVDYHPDIICYLFSQVVEECGGSFRCDYMGNGLVDLESE